MITDKPECYNPVFTHTITIYAGFRVGRTADQFAYIHDIDKAIRVCQEYCTKVGLCVTCTPTTFVHKGGNEPGVAVGLINYPRFPESPGALRTHAMKLAEILKESLEQMKVSVVFPDETVML